MKPFRIACLALGLSLARIAVASAAGEVAPPTRCADAPDRFVGGAACFTLGGRLWAASEFEGVEAGAIRGPFDGSRIADRSIPNAKLETPPGAGVLYRAETTRYNRGVVIDMGAAAHPAAGTLAFIKLPARVDGDDTQRVVVRTDTSTGTVRQRASALTDRGGGQLTWGELSGGHWALIARTPGEWVLLD